MATTDTHYTVLGVSESATLEEIKSAYRRLIRVYHPDANPNGNVDSTMATRINEAHDVLADADKRVMYDADLRLERGASTSAQTPAASTSASTAPASRSYGAYTPAGDVFSYSDLRGRGGRRVTLTNNWSGEWSLPKFVIWTVLSVVAVAGLLGGAAYEYIHLFQPSTNGATMVPRLLAVIYVSIILLSLRWKRSHGILAFLLFLGALLWPATFTGFHVAWLETSVGIGGLFAVTAAAAGVVLARFAVPEFLGQFSVRPIRTRVADRS